MDRHDIVACARQFAGVRFVHQGRSRDGLDCLGLLLVTAAEAEVTLNQVPALEVDVPTYGVRPDVNLLRARLDEALVPVACNEVQPGDVVLLKVDGSPQHLAIISDYPMAGELGMIHAYAPARRVIEHRYDSAWRRETYAAYRLPQFSDSKGE